MEHSRCYTKESETISISKGYYFECACGMRSKYLWSALECKHCMNYFPVDQYLSRKVKDLRTGKML